MLIALEALAGPGRDPVKAHVREAAGSVAQVAAENMVGLAEMDHVPEELESILIGLQLPPVQPGGQIVLTVGVVVAELAVAELVSRQEHGDAPAAHQQRKGVAAHPAAQGVDLGVCRLTLHAAVPAVVVISSVGVVPAVFQVVLLVVGVQIP